MKKTKRILSIGFAFLMLFGCTNTVLAHQGRLDRKGGHKDNCNVSGLGYYHYHCGENPAHLHANGVCPYAYNVVPNNATWDAGNSNMISEASETQKVNMYAAYEQDGVIGTVVTTDIKAYINGAEIPAYNVDGNMVIVGADLRSYGFDVVYNNDTRTSSVSLPENGGTWDPIIITNDSTLAYGTEVMKVYETDIKVLVNGMPVTGYNVDGRMAFRFAELAVFGTYYYDNDSRSTNLWISKNVYMDDKMIE